MLVRIHTDHSHQRNMLRSVSATTTVRCGEAKAYHCIYMLYRHYDERSSEKRTDNERKSKMASLKVAPWLYIMSENKSSIDGNAQ